MTRVPPLVRMIRTNHPGKSTLSEAARQLNVSSHRLRALIGHPDLRGVPSTQLQAGQNRVYVYSRADINRLRKFLEEERSSLTVKTDPDFEERNRSWRKERSRLHSRAYYYRNQLAAATADGDLDAVAKFTDQLAAVDRDLEDQRGRKP